MTVDHVQSHAMIEIHDLNFGFGSKVIYQDLNLSIPRGQITVIMGPSGTGKTTLLRLIGRQLLPTGGDIWVNGLSVATATREQLYELRKRMGFLFQQGALFTNLSVFENVAFPLREHTRLPESMINDIVLIKLQAVGLRGAAQLMTSQLSGGMARRVALARALALDPELMLYDEPFAGQDPIGRGVLMQLIKQLNTMLGMTSLIVSHDVREALALADFICVLADGKIIGQGTPEQIMTNQDPGLNQFIHGLPDGVVPFHYPAKSLQEDLFL